MIESRSVVPAGEYHRRGDLDVDAFRADLEQHRRFRVEQLDELTADLSAGSDEAMDEVASALMAAAETALADIDAALRRLDEGSYGLCRGCGGAIAVDRLTALPTAGLCMFCQFAQEVSGVRREHPAQPRDIVDIWGYDSFPAGDPPANW